MEIFYLENAENRHKKSRVRGENWTQEEKDLFLEIMKGSAPIIENKQTDTRTNKLKNWEWFKIQKALTKLTGKKRDITQIKGLWRRLKLSTKKNISSHKRALNLAGGGNQPAFPSEEDQKIIKLCPTEFITEINNYDSDSIYKTADEAVSVDYCVKNQSAEVKKNTLLDLDNIKREEDIICEVEAVNMDNCVMNQSPEVNKNPLHELDIKREEEIICEVNVDYYETEGLDRQAVNEMSHNIEIQSETCSSNSSNVKHKKTCDSTTPTTRKTEMLNNKAPTVDLNLKNRKMALLEEEYFLKIKYAQKELEHQEKKHKMEMLIMSLEKEKKELEIKALKKSLE